MNMRRPRRRTKGDYENKALTDYANKEAPMLLTIPDPNPPPEPEPGPQPEPKPDDEEGDEEEEPKPAG